MTVLDVAAKVALKVGLAVPDQLFASQAREHVELKYLINEAATDLADAYDWQMLRLTGTLTGNGSETGFDLPVDYGRMLKTSNVWSSRYQWSMRHVTDTDEWLGYLSTPFTQSTGLWSLFGGKMHVLAAMGSVETARFTYIDKNLVKDKDGALKEAFSADTDTFRLSEKVLALLTIYKWRDQKQQPTDGPAQDYNVALSQAIDFDGGSKPVLRDGSNFNASPNVWPGTIAGMPV